MIKRFFIIGSIFGGLAVAAGAFGAHGLTNFFSPEQLNTYEVAVRYQMYHALVLPLVTLAILRWPERSYLLNLSGWLFVAGTVLFSGSIYVLLISDLRWLGMVTPIGGTALVLGWGTLAWAVWRG